MGWVTKGERDWKKRQKRYVARRKWREIGRGGKEEKEGGKQRQKVREGDNKEGKEKEKRGMKVKERV